MSPVLFYGALLVIIYESLAKGWLSLFMLPLLIIVVPTLIIMRIMTQRRLRIGVELWLTNALLATLVSALCLYIFAVGFGDTETVFLFGFLTSVESSVLTLISNIIFTAAMATTVVGFIAWVVLYIRSRRRSHASKSY